MCRYCMSISYVALAFVFACCYCNKTEKEKNGICTRMEMYANTSVVPFTRTIKKENSKLCLSWWLICKDYSYETKTTNVTVTKHHSKVVYECCSGFSDVNGSCVPICNPSCLHGMCLKPGVCICKDGWKGDLCNEECKNNTYGRGCNRKCSCLNGATCEKNTGNCDCAPGYLGKYCEMPCPDGKYGYNCGKLCRCQNGGICDNINGKCTCQPGYNGELCDEKCEPGTYGPDCKDDCACINETTLLCSHTDGTCQCLPGWEGDFCEKQCSVGKWGAECNETCDCDKSDICDPITGECSCLPGWTGFSCNETCPDGTFGYNCLSRCSLCPNGRVCDPVTGHCECIKGVIGEKCEFACPTGHWGQNCHKLCKCSGQSSCMPKSGKCFCLPGWRGENCSEACEKGSYGFECAHTCNCLNGNFCNPVDGSCAAKVQDSQYYKICCASHTSKFILITALVLTVLLLVISGGVVIYKKTECKRKGRINISDSVDTVNSLPSDGKAYLNPTYHSTSRINEDPDNVPAESQRNCNVFVSISSHSKGDITKRHSSSQLNNEVLRCATKIKNNVRSSAPCTGAVNESGELSRRRSDVSEKRTSSARSSKSSSRKSNNEHTYITPGDVNEDYPKEVLYDFPIIVDGECEEYMDTRNEEISIKKEEAHYQNVIYIIPH